MYIRFVLLLSIILASSGCVNMKNHEKNDYKELERRLETTKFEPVEEKDPALAAALNVLPGFGNLYLEQYGIFVGNLLLWPASIAWGVPQGYIDSKAINKQETLYYYNRGPGKELLEEEEKEKADKVALNK